VLSAVSHPLDTTASQLPYPVLHDAIPQVPVEQDAVAFASEHEVLHAPQFVMLASDASHPFAGMPSQSPQVAWHDGEHTPEAHAVAPCALEQALPHDPQLLVVVSCVSQPFAMFPSQLPKPAAHAVPHPPPVHVGVPPEPLHTVAQLPQCTGSLFRFVSQPLLGFPSQFPNPLLHTGTHAPAVHAVVPFTLVHAAPHAPQWVVVFSGASHPSFVVPLQLPYPEVHDEMAQVPVAQLPVAFVKAQPTPQAPQFTSVVSVVSQPFAGLPSQLPQFEAQVGAHTPLAHAVVPWPLLQATPHPPQLVVVVSDSSQPLAPLLSQLPQPALHVIPHTPSAQAAVPFVALHALPQAPQLLALVCVLVSHPLTGFPSQLPYPLAQAGTHNPAWHFVVPFAFVHAAAHAPQSVVLVARSVSHPFCGLASQLPCPDEHTGTHAPDTQLVVPLAFVHALAHPPQSVTVVFVFVSHPLFGLPSQSAHPAAQVAEHVPLVHDAVPWLLEQAALHAPQFVFVVSEASQPLPTTLSQLP
jgi:hypothetical protein